MSEELKLNDLRRFAILTRTEVTYRNSRNGQTCVVSRKGTIEIPGLASRPTYNAEEVLAAADDFRLEPEAGPSRALPREELAALAKKYAPAGAAAKEE